MKKFLLATVCAVMLALTPVAASAECFPIEQAKVAVAEWDSAAQWEYLMEGSKYDAILKWVRSQNYLVEGLDGILVTYATYDGEKVVIFGVSPDGKCVEIAGSWKMSQTQFDDIVGQAI